MLEILIEELHNHLYLKSFYTDVRWRSYTRGQTCREFKKLSAPRRFTLSSTCTPSFFPVPVVDFGDDATDNHHYYGDESPPPPPAFLSGRSTARLPRMSKLQRFLQNLALKPAGAAADPTVDETLEELLVEPGGGEMMFGVGGGGVGVDSATANEDDTIVDGLDKDKDKEGGGAEQHQQQQQQQQRRSRPNPEVDSFAYIEMLLEALAALGKLGYALDAVGQRIQGELFALVEATIEEVEERQGCVSLSPPPFLPASLRLAGLPSDFLSDLFFLFRARGSSTGTIPTGLLPTR